MTQQHTFDTPEPIELRVEIPRGRVTISAEEIRTTEIEVRGKHADEIAVTHEGRIVEVIAPRWSGTLLRGHSSSLDVTVKLPTASSVDVVVGSADVEITGTVDECRIRSGSGDMSVDVVAGACVIATGSGDVRIGTTSAELAVKSGSGDVRADLVAGPASLSTGSGDIAIDHVGARLGFKSGSGSLRIGELAGDLVGVCASGDCVVDRAGTGSIEARTTSGNVIVGVPNGIPVWTDIGTVSGRIDAGLEPVGEPVADQDHLAVHARTVSGDIRLTNV